jgi:hypothetical protein
VQAPHISLALAGVEVISNGSGSHHQLRKLDTRLDLIRGATAKVGGPAAAVASSVCELHNSMAWPSELSMCEATAVRAVRAVNV